MELIELFLRDGTPVGVKVLVPVFQPPADVIQWGSRVFVYGQHDSDGHRRFQYREGMCFWATQAQDLNGAEIKS